MQAIDCLLARSRRHNRPLFYQSDLEIDREILARPDAPELFGWVLRECGTNLIDPRSPHCHKWLEAIIELDGAPTDPRAHHYYWWDGTSLRRLETGPALLERVLFAYVHNQPCPNCTRMAWDGLHCGRCGHRRDPVSNQLVWIDNLFAAHLISWTHHFRLVSYRFPGSDTIRTRQNIHSIAIPPGDFFEKS